MEHCGRNDCQGMIRLDSHTCLNQHFSKVFTIGVDISGYPEILSSNIFFEKILQTGELQYAEAKRVVTPHGD